jgi:hypothetical protein
MAASLESLSERLTAVETKLDRLISDNEKDSDTFVTRAEFEPIRTIIYGMVGCVLLAFLGGLTALVLGAKP